MALHTLHYTYTAAASRDGLCTTMFSRRHTRFRLSAFKSLSPERLCVFVGAARDEMLANEQNLMEEGRGRRVLLKGLGRRRKEKDGDGFPPLDGGRSFSTRKERQSFPKPHFI